MTRPRIFDGLNDIDAATARRRFAIQVAEPGEVLIREGEVGRAMGCLVSGRLTVESRGAAVGELRPGAIIGEVALFEDTLRTATVIAAERSELWLLGRDEYEELRDTLHPIGANIETQTLESQVSRIGHIGERVATLGLGPRVDRPPTSGFFATLRRMFGAGDTRPAGVDPASALAASRLFSDAPTSVIPSIAAHFEAVACEPGAVLCREGEVGDQMYLLVAGAIEVIVQGDDAPHRVATLAPGDAFGMVSLARGGVRMSSCVATTPATVLRLPRSGWDALVAEPYLAGSTFRRAVIRAFAEQLRASNEQLAASMSSKQPVRLD